MAEAEKRLQTKQRPLEVACKGIAEKGFRNARVRDLCIRAKANVAAFRRDD